MAKRKRVVRRVRRVSRSSRDIKLDSSKRKIWFAFWNFIIFTVLSLIFFILSDYAVIRLTLFSFALFGLICGAIAILFLIIWLVFLLTRIIKN